ncbi:hypothetical protein AALB_1743 [Agarivorans albus MKT 106]|uniref:Uncharacterized protein n=1 Tax=Agarivorans albus MKT 106 TaxID=1331007 RepID=R9PK77_AGAAL|nr:hypothetical protein AALB_1743 [Agarivorans albus MKT 106]
MASANSVVLFIFISLQISAQVGVLFKLEMILFIWVGFSTV